MATWEKYKLADIIDIIGGGTPRTTVPEYWNGDIPWLSVVDFGGDMKYVYQTEKFITQVGLKNSSTKILKKGEIILSARGTVGEMAMLGKDMSFNQSCYGITAKPDFTNNSYLYYLMKIHIQGLQSISHGSVFDTITRETFNQIEVEIPTDLPTQTRIASILSALDDKIELNRQMNQTLEQMAQALFKKYFVDDIDADNLPEGWRWGKLGEMITINQNSITRNTSLQEIEYYDTSSITLNHFQLPQKLKIEDAPSRAKRLMKHKSILYSTVRPNQLHYGIIHHPKTNTVASTGFAVIDANEMSSYFVFGFLSQQPVIERLDSIAEASATTFPAFNPERLREIELPIPSKIALSEFEKIADTLYEKIYSNQIENECLTKLRDTLLPKLMSGEIEVNAEIENEIFS